MILALAGGVGGAKLAQGLAQNLAPDELTVIVNTGDDFRHLGLRISPDLDTVMYTLAEMNDKDKGWGVANETWNFMESLTKLGGETWFQLGDRDLATNIERTHKMDSGQSLSAVTGHLCQQLGIAHRIAPMSDNSAPTKVHTSNGILDFQDYFVRQRAEPTVIRLEYAATLATMSETLRNCLGTTVLDAVVICPSNPYLSIAPILAIPGVRDALAKLRVPILAVSPIIEGRALKGPAAKIMRELGKPVSPIEIARFYEGLIDGLVIDEGDAKLSDTIAQTGVTPFVTRTIMSDARDRQQLAQDVIQFAGQLRMTTSKCASA